MVVRQRTRRLRFESLEAKRLLASLGHDPVEASADPMIEELSHHSSSMHAIEGLVSLQDSHPGHHHGHGHPGEFGGRYVANHHEPFMPDFSQAPAALGRSVVHSSGDGDWQAMFDSVGSEDVVVIRHEVTLDGMADVHTIVIGDGGTLRFNIDGEQLLRVVHLQVLEGGRLEIGTVEAPHRGTAEIVFKDVPIDLEIDPGQYGNGLVAFGAVSMHGTSLTQTYATLDGEVLAGATSLPVVGDTTDWRPGDQLLIPDSRQLFYTADVAKSLNRYDLPTLASAGAGRLHLTEAAQFDHLGARNADGELVFTPHVANLTRNVVLRSENPQGVRGHTMLIGRAEIDIRYVEFRDMGRATNEKADNTVFHSNGHAEHVGTNQAGRYPIHFHHLIGPTEIPANGHQFTAIGNSVHSTVDGLKWGITIHGSHYGLVHENVVYNYAGAGIVTEDGTESFNQISNNFISRIPGTNTRGKFSGGREGSGIWLKRPNNYVDGNVVSGATKAAYAIYGGDNTEAPAVRIPAFQGADPHTEDHVLLAPKQMSLLSFDGNTGYASQLGLDLWYLGYETYYNPSRAPVPHTEVNDLALWHINHTAVFGEQANNVSFNRMTIIGSQDDGSSYNYPTGFQVLRVKEVSITNSTIENYRFGITVPHRVDGLNPSLTVYDVAPFRIQDSQLRNDVNVRVNTPQEDASASTPARYTLIDNVQFEVNPTYMNKGGQDILMSFTAGRFANATQNDLVEVVAYNGVAGQDFQMFYAEQSPDFIVPKSRIDALSGKNISHASPVEGLTNAQLWEEYGLAVAGEVAPGLPSSADRLVYPNTNGLAFPLTRGSAEPRILAITDSSGMKVEALTAEGRLNFRGVTMPELPVDLYNGDALLASTTADQQGIWTIDLTSVPFASGDYQFIARVDQGMRQSAAVPMRILVTPPSAENVNVSIPEDTAVGMVVAELQATDPDPHDVLSYEIVSGNESGAFRINPATGVVTLSNGAQLNSATRPTYSLGVRVTDSVGLTDDATMTVDVTARPPGFWVTQLTYTALGSLNAEEIAFVTPQQIRQIPNAYWFRQIPAEVRATLRTDQLSQLRLDQPGMLPLLTPQQMLSLAPEQYQLVPYSDFQFVPAERISSLAGAQIAAIPTRYWLAIIPAAKRAQLTSDQVTFLNIAPSNMIGLLTTAQINALTPNQVQTLSYIDFGTLTATQVVHLNAGQLQSIPNPYWLAQIPAQTRRQFTDQQVGHLNLAPTGMIALLTPTQVDAVTVSQLHSLGFKDFGFLSPTQVTMLSRSQLESIVNAHWFNQISAAGRSALQDLGITWVNGVGVVFPS